MKKIFQKIIVILSALSIVGTFISCSPINNDGVLYDICRAYEKKVISYEDIKEIYSIIQSSEQLELPKEKYYEIGKAFLMSEGRGEDYIDSIKNRFPEMSIEEIIADNLDIYYFGEYNGNYAVAFYCKLWTYNTMMTVIKVAGYEFYGYFNLSIYSQY